jgi:hypothetical protein
MVKAHPSEKKFKNQNYFDYYLSKYKFLHQPTAISCVAASKHRKKNITVNK